MGIDNQKLGTDSDGPGVIGCLSILFETFILNRIHNYSKILAIQSSIYCQLPKIKRHLNIKKKT